jgi:hypothetical protein
MPRYFFSCEGAQTFTDERGTELPDARCAWVQAIQNAGEVMRDHALDFAKNPRWRVTVADEAGEVLFTLHFSAEEGTAVVPK